MGKISYALSLLKQYELEDFKSYIKSVGLVELWTIADGCDPGNYEYPKYGEFVISCNQNSKNKILVIHKAYCQNGKVYIVYSVWYSHGECYEEKRCSVADVDAFAKLLHPCTLTMLKNVMQAASA